MPSWNTDQYLKFGNERTQPAVDLASRVAVASPRRVVDLGCGPGNSTAVVAARWPAAQVTGVDNSPVMLAAARRDHPEWQWEEADIAAWVERTREAAPFDVVFSNAALQWVPGHIRLFPLLLNAVAPGGALAFQLPSTLGLPHQQKIRELAESLEWQTRFTHRPIPWHVETPEAYYDALAPRAARVDLWITEYVHVLEGVAGVVEWYRGTGLRPFLDALQSDSERTAFVRAYEDSIRPFFPARADGKTLMYFRRLFVVAYR
jgi:trans-aconitate 2-methyltransferase